jgi:thymidine kinase
LIVWFGETGFKMGTDPEFIIFTGPMFGSKTSRLLAVVDRYRYQRKHVLAFKPMMDKRYSRVEICTHSGARLPAKGVSCGKDILQEIEKHSSCDVIVVDEAFMIDGCATALLKLFKGGKSVVVSSLQLSASGKVFEEIRDMMPWATKVEVCPAVCPITGRDAFYTHRKIEGLNEIAVGGAEMYEPRCWEFHNLINCKNGESDGGACER